MFEYQTYITDKRWKIISWNLEIANSIELTLEMYLIEVSMGNGYVLLLK